MLTIMHCIFQSGCHIQTMLAEFTNCQVQIDLHSCIHVTTCKNMHKLISHVEHAAVDRNPGLASKILLW